MRPSGADLGEAAAQGDVQLSDAVPPGQDIEEEQFRLLAEHLPVLCWMANADGYIFWYNRRWHEYCGSTPEEMAGWGWQSVHDPAVLPAVLDRWTGCIAAGEPFEMTFPLRGADGVFHPFLTRIKPLRDTDGNVRWWFGVNVDVAAQVAAESELRAKNTAYHAIAAEREAILSQLGEGVIVTDTAGRITFVNDAAARLHGVVRLDVAPDDYTEAYSLSTIDGAPFPTEDLPLTRAVRLHETVVDARWKIQRPDGTEVLALGNAKPIYAEDKSLAGAVLTIRDDTHRHAAEEALAQSLKMKEVLLQEVNHRVKNNLQLVTSLLFLQAERSQDADVKASLLEARSRIGVVAAMHQRLYNATQHDRVQLSSYLREIASETIVALDGERRIILRFESDEDFPVSLDDAMPLALVINELLTNAMKYAFDGLAEGIISIHLCREADDLLLKISDDGHGLPDGFDPASSNGLGMLIVTALVAQVRGRLTVVPDDQGAGFVIAIPAARLIQAEGQEL